MKEQLEAFALQIPEIQSKSAADLISYFVYFLTVVQGEELATPAGVARCFEILRIPAYSNISSYLSKHSARGKAQKFLKQKAGYQLSRGTQLGIQETLHTGPAKLETSLLLRALLPKISDTSERSFLLEAIDCYEIGARRAAIVMSWLLALHHLQEHVFKHELSAFNVVLGKNTDKRIKISQVTKRDDFGEIPEGKFIEFARSANIISNDVRKILDVKLGIRNSTAHPAVVTVSQVKATDFIIDLVENVVLKYAV